MAARATTGTQWAQNSMRVLCNEHSRITYALPIVSVPNMFVIGTLHKENLNFMVSSSWSMRGSGLEEFRHGFTPSFGPSFSTNGSDVNRTWGVWFHGDINDETTWEPSSEVSNITQVFDIKQTLWFEAEINGDLIVTEKVSLDELVSEVAKFFKASSYLEKLEERASNNGRDGHYKWLYAHCPVAA